MIIQIKIRRLLQDLVPSLLFIAAASCYASEKQPENQYFRGVEDRIREADAIVVGHVEVMSEDSAEGSSQRVVRARISVVQILKGDQSLREIEYSTRYSPQGFASYSGRGYWGTEDEEHSRLVECFPYALGRPAVFFLKQEQQGLWKPFYGYIDDEAQTLRSAIKDIIATECRLERQPSAEVLSPMLGADNPLMLRKYAVRAIMRRFQSWPERTGTFLAAGDELSNTEDFYFYLVADVRKVKGMFASNRDRGKALQTALLNRRAALGKQVGGPIGLTVADEALLADIGLSTSQ